MNNITLIVGFSILGLFFAGNLTIATYRAFLAYEKDTLDAAIDTTLVVCLVLVAIYAAVIGNLDMTNALL